MHSLSERLKKLVSQFTHSHRNQFDFEAAKNAHLAWKGRLRSYLDNRSSLTEEQAVSHKQCYLGKWYYGEGMSKYGEIPEMLQIEGPHAELHTTIKEIVRLKQEGRREEAERAYLRTEGFSQRIVELLSKVQDHVARQQRTSKP